MTNLSIVAIGVILIAFVVYLAIEQRGQDIHWYAGTHTSLGDASGYDLQSANALVTVTGRHGPDPDPARTGEDRVTYTLTAVDQSPNYRQDASRIQSTSRHVFDFDDGTCIEQALTGTPASLQLTTSFDSTASGCMFAAAAHGEHDTAFYYNGTSAGDATGVDITSGNTALLTVGGASVAADTLRAGQNRMTYTLTPTDPSPEYEVGASNIQATYPYDVDFRQGACIAQSIGGTPSNVQVTTSFDSTTTPCMFAPATHAHPHTHPTILHSWTFSCEGTPSGDPLQICDFEIESGMQESGIATTRDTFRNFDDDLEFRTVGNYLLDFSLELHFIAPGSLIAGQGSCASGTRTQSTAAAVAPSRLATATPSYSPDFIDGNATPMPAGNFYCEGTASPVDTVPNRVADVALQNDFRQQGPYSFSLRDDDPETLLEEAVTVTRDTTTMAGGYYPQPTLPVADVTNITSSGDELEFGLYELGTGDYVLDRNLTKLHLVILRLQ